jgi:hypothetical protein
MRQSRHPEIMKECDGRYAEVSPSYEGGEKEGVGNLYTLHLASPFIKGGTRSVTLFQGTRQDAHV